MLYSYATDDRKNRSLLKIGDSTWSKPQSFDAIGSSYEVVLASASGKSELHVGVSVAEGQGKYSLTKVVTMAPRFVLKNKIGEDIELREPGSSEILKMKNNDLLPIYFMRQSPEKQICICFPGVNNLWSSPFNLANVGMTHVKLAKHGQRQRLIRVEIILEDATLFLHFSIETKHWPFSMRNESDTEFLFFQANPNIAEDDEEEDADLSKDKYVKQPKKKAAPKKAAAKKAAPKKAAPKKAAPKKAAKKSAPKKAAPAAAAPAPEAAPQPAPSWATPSHEPAPGWIAGNSESGEHH